MKELLVNEDEDWVKGKLYKMHRNRSASLSGYQNSCLPFILFWHSHHFSFRGSHCSTIQKFFVIKKTVLSTHRCFKYTLLFFLVKCSSPREIKWPAHGHMHIASRHG